MSLPSVLRFERPPAEAALFFPEHSFSSRSDDLLVRGPMGVVLLSIITLLVDVALKNNLIQFNISKIQTLNCVFNGKNQISREQELLSHYDRYTLFTCD